jgi:cell wall-associated NlpC family hydrolase
MANVDLTIAHRAQVEAQLKAMLEIADEWKGIPYFYGGNSKSGIDCSHFVYQVLNGAREKVFTEWIPQVVHYQSTNTIEQSGLFFPVGAPQHGDLVLWDGHVGIVRDPGSKSFIGAQEKTGVADANYGKDYWAKRKGMRFRRFVHFF